MWPPGAAMGFELADDDDDFWADATTMGCASFAPFPSEPARPRAGAALSSRNLGTLQIRTAVFPPTPDQPTPSRTRFDRAIEEMERQARDTSKSQGEPAAGSSYPLMPPTSGGSARVPTPPPVGAGGSFRGGSAGADVEAILREKELELGTKDAHLRMLRSRLDMADRDAEEMRRKLDAANARLAAAGGNRDANLADSTNRNANLHSSAYSGPNARDVSNVAALAEAKADVARLRAQVAFREEEAEEARRREDDQRARLQRAEAETMKLAAEVRSERRRAEQLTGTRKRAAADDDDATVRVDAGDGDANRRGGSKRRRGLGVEEEPGRAGRSDDGGGGEEEGGGEGARRSARIPARRSPPPPPVTLVLPPPPPHARIAASRASGGDGASFWRVSGVSSSAAELYASISARFPEETCALLGEDADPAALGLHPTGPGDVDGGAVLLKTIGNVSRALRNLSADRGDARELTRACAAAVAAAADAPKATVKSAAHLERARARGEELTRGSGVRAPHHPGIAGVLSILSAAVEADPCTAAHVLELCGAPLRAVPASVAPRAPPPQLAGIPAASGAGALVPHPISLGSSPRVFAPAPTDTVADIAAAAADGGGSLADPSEGGSPDELRRGLGSRPRLSPGALLENVCAVLAASAASGGWAMATAACEFLARCVAASPAMEGRGVFVACAGDGVLERCLVPSRNVQKRRKSSLERSWNGSAKTSSALAAARAHEPANASRRTPPPGLKLRALVVARLLAATDAFTAFLDEEGGGGGSKSSTPRANSAAAAAADVLDLTVEPASQTAAGAGAGTGGDGSRDAARPEEEHEPSPLLAAVVAATAAANDDDDAGIEALGISDAALSVVHALSHGGWRGWGEAVRAHAILPAALDACDAAFRRRAAAAAARGVSGVPGESDADGVRAERRVKGALMLVARLLAEPGSAARAIAGLRRDGETARVLARVAAAAGAHPEQMPRRVGRYFASLLPTVTPQVGE